MTLTEKIASWKIDVRNKAEWADWALSICRNEEVPFQVKREGNLRGALAAAIRNPTLETVSEVICYNDEGASSLAISCWDDTPENRLWAYKEIVRNIERRASQLAWKISTHI